MTKQSNSSENTFHVRDGKNNFILNFQSHYIYPRIAPEFCESTFILQESNQS